MSQEERDAQTFAPIAQRLSAELGRILDMETARSSKEGVSGDVFIRGIIITFLEMTARLASMVISPHEDPKSEKARSRMSRFQEALSQTLVQVINAEAGKVIVTSLQSWTGRGEGHA
jgi:hypothetical protein